MATFDEELAALRGHLLSQGIRTEKVEVILAAAQPAIRLHLARVEDEAAIPIGASKLGGRPDVPAHLAWPACDGQPLAFLAQIGMQDVAPYDVAGDLPHEGLLAFFYGLHTGGGDTPLTNDDPAGWRVLHLTEEAGAASHRGGGRPRA